MKKIFYILFLLILSFLVIIYSKDISFNITKIFDTWKTNIFPSLFPFFIISKILINYGFTPKIFNINPNYSFIFLMSMISGFPSSAKYTKELVDKGIVSYEDANKIILFTHFSNPAFILITLSSNFLKNTRVGFLILFSHYISNLVIALFVKGSKSKSTYKKDPKPFSYALNDAIKDTLSTLFLILGTLVTYSIIITLFNKLPINIYYKSILIGLIELTEGLRSVSLLNISLRLKASLCTFLLSFGGLAIHTQVINIIKINYKKYLIFRIFHASLSFLITYFLFNLFYRL